jgi:hypothetical protein
MYATGIQHCNNLKSLIKCCLWDGVSRSGREQKDNIYPVDASCRINIIRDMGVAFKENPGRMRDFFHFSTM